MERRPYLNEKVPQEHSILIIRKMSVFVSVEHVSFTTNLTFSCSKSTLEIVAKVRNIFKIRLKTAYRNSWTQDARVGRWTLDAGLWTLDSGRCILNPGR